MRGAEGCETSSLYTETRLGVGAEGLGTRLVRNWDDSHAYYKFSRIILYIPPTKTSGRHWLLLRSTTRPCTENTREVATSKLLVICGWVVVIASLAHRGYSEDRNDQLGCCILVTLEVSLSHYKSTVRVEFYNPSSCVWHARGFRKCSCVGVAVSQEWVATSKVASFGIQGLINSNLLFRRFRLRMWSFCTCNKVLRLAPSTTRQFPSSG